MNGRIAKMTRLSHRLFAGRASIGNLRPVLLIACCVMSLALLGAVRLVPHFRPDDVIPVSPLSTAGSNEATPAGEMAATESPVTLSALHQHGEATLEHSPTPPAEPAELLRAARSLPDDELLMEDAVVAASVFRASPTPTLAGPKLRKIMMEVTAYCPCPRCCGPRAQGITASGRRVSYNGGRFVAADTRILKFNTKLLIPGYAGAQPVEVIDKGGAIKGNKLDVYFPTHQEARKWGRQKLLVTVVEN